MEKARNKPKNNSGIKIDLIPNNIYFDELNADNFIPTINVFGCGGTGSYVLSNLARINYTLKLLGRPGFHVKAIDSDVVSEFNIGRSMFSPVDIGKLKSVVLINRINRFYGFNFEADIKDSFDCNIGISCVDTIKAREKIFESFFNDNTLVDHKINYILIDCGNSDYQSHCSYQTENNPTVLDLFKQRNNGVMPIDDNTTPSCSMHEALLRQSMNINMGVGLMVSKYIEDTFDMGIKYNFMELNLDTFTTNKFNLLWGN